MPRVKVVSDPADLVSLLRAFDSPVKRAVFHAILGDWRSRSQIETTHGSPGTEALLLLEKAHLVETRWVPGPKGPEKAYRSYYTAFHINASCPVEEVADLLHVAVMADADFQRYEADLAALAGQSGVSTRVACDKLGVSLPFLKGLLKRSSRVDLKGHLVAPSKDS